MTINDENDGSGLSWGLRFGKGIRRLVNRSQEQRRSMDLTDSFQELYLGAFQALQLGQEMRLCRHPIGEIQILSPSQYKENPEYGEQLAARLRDFSEDFCLVPETAVVTRMMLWGDNLGGVAAYWKCGIDVGWPVYLGGEILIPYEGEPAKDYLAPRIQFTLGDTPDALEDDWFHAIEVPRLDQLPTLYRGAAQTFSER